MTTSTKIDNCWIISFTHLCKDNSVIYTAPPIIATDQEPTNYATALEYVKELKEHNPSMLFFPNPVININTVSDKENKSQSFVYVFEQQMSGCAPRIIVPEDPVLSPLEMFQIAQAKTKEESVSYVPKAVHILDEHKISRTNLPKIGNSAMFNEDGIYTGPFAAVLFQAALALESVKQELHESDPEELKQIMSDIESPSETKAADDARYLVVKPMNGATTQMVTVSDPENLLTRLEADNLIAELIKADPAGEFMVLPSLTPIRP